LLDNTYHCGLDSSHLIRLARQVAHPVRDLRCVLRGFILERLGACIERYERKIGAESFIAPLEGEAANQNPIGKV
jgi:hypothetical protein